ncbi:MAG: ATP-binding protein, partial [Pseudomonadota bacterium]
MREHWRGADEQLPISTPLADLISKTAARSFLDDGTDPFAIGKDEDEDDYFSLDTLMLETTSVRFALSAWLIGRGLQRCLQTDAEDIIGHVSRLSSRGAVNIIRVPQGLGSGLDEAFTETCFARPFSLFQKAICSAVDGVVAADRVPSIQRYGWTDDGSAGCARRHLSSPSKGWREDDELDAQYERRVMIKEVMKDLGQGQSVLCLISDDFEVPDMVRSIVSSEIRLTPIVREDIIALLQLTHSVTGRVAIDALRKWLPRDEDLATLPMAILVAAFSRPTTLQVAEFLSVQVGLIEVEKSRSSHSLDAPASEPGKARPRLKDLRGQPAASRELGRLAEDVEDWRAGRAAWSDIETSVLFHGPPGAGKSMAATALANELGVPLIDASMGKCQAKGSLSHTLKAFEAAVNEAREKTPSVLLMDELDSLMDRNIRDYNGYMRLLVNATLESLTRIQSYEGVILIGTTHNLQDIDPAIRKSGRFDVKIPMQLPDLVGLTSIVTHGLKGNIEDGAETTETFSRALRQMVGLLGADAGAIVRRARGEARR